METIGKVKNIKMEHEVEWKILYFSSLSEENYTSYCSSKFSFCNESWYFKMCPNGMDETSTGYVGLFLMKMSSAAPIKIKYSLGLKTLSGRKYIEQDYEYTFNSSAGGYGTPKFFLRSQLFEEKADLLPSDVITVFCTLQLPTSLETPEEKVSTGICSLCEKSVDADDLSAHQKKDKTIKCAECSAILTSQNWCNHQCQAEGTDCQLTTALSKDDVSESSKILDDFKELFLKQKECDMVIKVKDQEFLAHKAILIARSSVFESTFQNDMKERKSGIIDIEDCDPSYFSHFLCFLYSGDSENISEENVFDLFVIADRYDVKDLKIECIKFIKKNLSVDIFCDAITLALQYSETELIKLATEFFAKNLQKIIVTVKWKSFVIENPIQSNELFIKALVTDENSDV